MKKNRLFVLGIITMFVAILSLTLVSGTMARYTSEISGSDTARVAKWSVLVENVDAAEENNFTINLFKTIIDTKNDDVETDVKPGNGTDQIIAPGTKGSFEINLKNASEVTAAYAIDFTVTNSMNIPVKFSLTGAEGSWVDSIEDIEFDNPDSPTNNALAANGGETSFTIYWQWAYAGNDALDTNLGVDGSATITVDVKVTFTQVD